MATTISTGQTASTLPQKKGDPPNLGTVKSGRALAFDGVVDYLTLSIGTKPLNNVTVACWINSTFASTWDTILGHADGFGDYIWFQVKADGTIACALNGIDGGGADAYGDFISASSTTIVADTWQRVVMTYDSTSGGVIYVDGVSVATTSSIGAIDDDAGNLQIGKSGSSDYHFGGNMSDWQLWDATWTATDVTNDYTHPEMLAHTFSGTSLASTNLKAWYPMTEGNPESPQTTIFDGSPKVLGSELLTNRDFSDDTSTDSTSSALAGWTNGGSHDAYNKFTISSGQCNILTAQGGALADIQIYQSILTVGKVYRVSFDLISTTGSTVIIWSGGNQGSFSTVDTHVVYFTATDVKLQLDNGGTGIVVVDNISCKEVQRGNHATSVFYGDELNTEENAISPTGITEADDVSGWTSVGSWGGQALQSSSDDAHTGLGTYHFHAKASADGDVLKEEITVVVGKTYKVNYWYKVLNGDSGSGLSRIAGPTDGSGAYQSASSWGGSWTEESFTFVATSTTLHFQLREYGEDNDAEFYFDDLSVKEVGLSTTGHVEGQETIFQPAFVGQNRQAVFDGVDDYFTKTIANYRSSDSKGSISAWVRCPSTITTATIFSSADTSGSLYSFNFGVYSGELQLFETDNDTLTNVKSTTSINDNQWHHCVLTSNGSAYKMYINGSEETLATNTENDGNWFDTTGASERDNIVIGALKRSSLSSFLEGNINEVSVWNDDLSLTEVQELYNDGVPLDANSHSAVGDLVNYWRNNNLHTDGTWKDLKGSDNLTASGSPTIMILPEGTTSGRDINGFFLTHPNKNYLSCSHNNNTTDTFTSIDIPYSSVFDFNVNDFTVECWIKYDFENIGSAYNSAVSIGGGIGGANPGWAIAVTTDALYFLINGTAIAYSVSDIGTWYHLVGVRKSGAGYFYVNGVRRNYVTSGNVANTVSPTSNKNIKIGADENVSRGYTSMVDDVRIYNRALTDGGITSNGDTAGGEIRKNYRHGTAKHKD